MALPLVYHAAEAERPAEGSRIVQQPQPDSDTVAQNQVMFPLVVGAIFVAMLVLGVLVG